MTKIGVLALQGDFQEHCQVLRRLGVEAIEVRQAAQLDDLDGLIIPGGESTTIARLMDIYGIREPLKERSHSGMAVWGTCAGMIVLAKRLTEDRPKPIGLMDITVARNAFGRQVDSFETELKIPALGDAPFRAVFIRAPKVVSAGKGVEILASLEGEGPVAVRQDNMLATSFHPELTEDTRLHSMFLEIASNSK